MRAELAEFFIRGSKGDEYKVIFESIDDTLRTHCSCKARLSRQWCRHRTAILNGETDALTMQDLSPFQKLKQMIKGSRFEAAFSKFTQADHDLEIAKAERDKAKRALLKEVQIV